MMMMMALLGSGRGIRWLPGRRMSDCVCMLQHGFEILVISQSLSLHRGEVVTVVLGGNERCCGPCTCCWGLRKISIFICCTPGKP